MIIENEFTVGAEIDTVWRTLLDMEGVASCLPGATITRHRRGERLQRLDAAEDRPDAGRVPRHGDTRRGRRAGAHGGDLAAARARPRDRARRCATITNQLEADGRGHARASPQTDLHITGPQAQFGRGVIEDVGKRVLGEFSQCLEQKIGGGQADGTGGVAAGGASRRRRRPQRDRRRQRHGRGVGRLQRSGGSGRGTRTEHRKLRSRASSTSVRCWRAVRRHGARARPARWRCWFSWR